jgi:phosphoserine phosphatase RsbU/P
MSAQAGFGQAGVLATSFVVFGAFFNLIAAPALMLFGVTFPTRLAVDRRVLWLFWVVAGYLVLVTALEAVNVATWINHLAWAHVFGRPVEFLTGLEGDFGAAVQAVALVVCVGSLGWKTLRSPSRDARRRLLVVDAGAATSVAALLVILIAGRFEVRLPAWSVVPLLGMLLALPLAMANAILVHRAMDVRVAIRQGLQYLLAAGSVRALQFVLGVAIVVGATLLSANFNTPRRLTATGLGITLIFILRTVAERLRGWVDRRFFRKAYEADAILSDLATKVRTIVETGPLLETVATRIAESLHVPRIAILLDGGGRFRPAYAMGYSTPPSEVIPHESLTVKRLRKQQHALVQFDDEDSWGS